MIKHQTLTKKWSNHQSSLLWLQGWRHATAHDGTGHVYLLRPVISSAHLSRRRHESGLNKDRRAPEKLPTSNNFMAEARAQARHNTTFVMMSS